MPVSGGRLAGNLAAMAGSVLFGGAVVATRSAGEDVSPLVLAVLRFGQGGLILFGVLALFDATKLRLERRDLPLVVFLAGILFAVFPLLFNGALRLTTASRGAVMLATMPLWSVVFGRFFGREALTRRQGLGVVLSCAGVAVVFARGGGGGSWSDAGGNALMLLAAAAGALYAVFAKPLLRRYPAALLTAYTMTLGAAMLLPFAVAAGFVGEARDLDGRTLLLVLYLGVLAGAGGYFLISYGLARLSPTQSTVYINLNPLVAAALGATLLDESLSASFALGFAIVVAGVVLTNWPQTPAPPGSAQQRVSPRRR